MEWGTSYSVNSVPSLRLGDSNYKLLSILVCHEKLENSTIYFYELQEGTQFLNFNDIVELLGAFSNIDELKSKIETYYRLHGYS